MEDKGSDREYTVRISNTWFPEFSKERRKGIRRHND